MKFLNDLSWGGKITLLAIICGLIFLGNMGYKKFFPKKVKNVVVTTKATSLPPLAYDKNSNASFRKLPEFNEPADVQAPEVRGAIMGWNGFSAVNYAVGGISLE